MTDDRDKSSRSKESLARTTARDVPLTRGAGSESEPAPRGQRPAQLPRDPTYEAELAQVELAVLRDPERRDDPSTKQGGRRGHSLPASQALAPESVTPESPATRAPREVVLGRSPQPPSTGGHSVASGTLLSVGAVDPRGKTERTLETPRMFFSQPEAGGEAYFKPGKIPAVTVHQTLETETVKLSDSVDPRRAKTMPRIDRSALQRYAETHGEPESDGPVALSHPDSLDLAASDASPRWNQQEYEPASSLGEHDGQIHASLSPFRDQAEPSYTLDGTPTRPEPLAARRGSQPPESLPAPDTSTIPTQRDLPAHRIEASRPPPPPASVHAPVSARLPHSESDVPMSEVARPTTASISAEEPQSRPIWLNFAAFGVALLVALAIGWWLTSSSQQQASPETAPSAPVVVEAKPADAKPADTKLAEPPPADVSNGSSHHEDSALPSEPAPARVGVVEAEPAPAAAPVRASKPAPAAPQKPPPSVVPAAPAAARKSSPAKSSHESIF